MTYEEDRQLLAAVFDGDRRATEIFVLRFSDLVYRSIQHTLILKHIRYTRDDLEDLHNTVFLHLFDNRCKKLRQYQGKNGCSLATWVRTVTVRIILNEVRKKGVNGIRGKDKSIPLDELPELKEKRWDAGELVEKSEQERMIQEGIQNLPPRERLFLKLHFDQELSLPEVAEAMGITVKNAYTIKHRALLKLKEYVLSKGNHY